MSSLAEHSTPLGSVANALRTTTTSVNVSNAAAPSVGQVFETTSPTSGIWKYHYPRHFNVKDYGALGDGVLLNDCYITAGTNIANSALASFTSADIGKAIEIAGAGAGGIPLRANISGVNSPTQITISVNASTTVAAVTVSPSQREQYTYYGTDDTSSVQDAINAALEQAFIIGGRCATVFYPIGIYMIAGALQDTSYANAQLYLPDPVTVLGLPTDSRYRQVSIKMVGEQGPSSGLNLIGGAPIITRAYGVVLKSTLNSSATGALFRAKNRDSGVGGTLSEYLVHIHWYNMVVRMPENSVMSALDFGYCGCMSLGNLMVDSGNSSGARTKQPTTTTSYGIVTPYNNNNNHCIFEEDVTVSGFYNGVQCNEHLRGDVKIQACWNAMVFPFAYHAVHLRRVMAQACRNNVVVTGSSYIQIDQLNMEHEYTGVWGGLAWMDSSLGYDVDDASNLGHGKITWHAVKGYVGVESVIRKNGGTGITCTEL